MIRPLTIATFLMACGSGLYLYQCKHEAQVLDRTIEKTVRDTAALREQSRLLSTEWTMLNDPDTLRHFADTYLSLKPIAPSQFTSLADLDSRLPPVQLPAEAPSRGSDDDPAPVASAGPVVTPPAVAAASVLVQENPEPAPHRPAAIAAAAPARPMEKKLAAARPVAVETPADPRPVATGEARPPDQHVADARAADPRPSHAAEVRAADARAPYVASPVRPTVFAAAPRPNPPAAYSTAPYPSAPYTSAPGPITGSLLGMARTGAPSVPRPTPVNATQWASPN